MLDKLKTLLPPFKWLVGAVLGAIVLIWFWHPTCQYIAALACKADAIFP